MIGDGRDGTVDVEYLAEMFERRHAARRELNANQLAAMDALWRAERAGDVASDEAREIERMIRRGHAPGARKRLTNLRRGDAPPE